MKAFVIAMDNEAQCLIDNMTNRVEAESFGRRTIRGMFNDEGVLLVISGIGKVNAAAATQFAIQSGADEIINFGVAGGLVQTMQVGDIYEVTDAVQYDFDLTQVNQTPMGTLNEYDSPYIGLTRAKGVATGEAAPSPRTILATGDRFNDSKADHELITTTLGCSLRDMEGGAIAHVCRKAGVACRIVKCVSDVYGRGSTTEQYLDNLRHCLEKLTRVLPQIFR